MTTKNIWKNLLELFIDDSSLDDEIDEIVANIIISDAIGEEEIRVDTQFETYPFTVDGSRRRKVHRDDYSRRAKEKKSADDPRLILKGIRWIKDPVVF